MSLHPLSTVLFFGSQSLLSFEYTRPYDKIKWKFEKIQTFFPGLGCASQTELLLPPSLKLRRDKPVRSDGLLGSARRTRETLISQNQMCAKLRTLPSGDGEWIPLLFFYPKMIPPDRHVRSLPYTYIKLIIFRLILALRFLISSIDLHSNDIDCIVNNQSVFLLLILKYLHY